MAPRSPTAERPPSPPSVSSSSSSSSSVHSSPLSFASPVLMRGGREGGGGRERSQGGDIGSGGSGDRGAAAAAAAAAAAGLGRDGGGDENPQERTPSPYSKVPPRRWRYAENGDVDNGHYESGEEGAEYQRLDDVKRSGCRYYDDDGDDDGDGDGGVNDHDAGSYSSDDDDRDDLVDLELGSSGNGMMNGGGDGMDCERREELRPLGGDGGVGVAGAETGAAAAVAAEAGAKARGKEKGGSVMASASSNASGTSPSSSPPFLSYSATVVLWLLFWLFNNVALTLLNKATFAKYDFKYPLFLSCFHMLCNSVGGEIMICCAEWKRRWESRDQDVPTAALSANAKESKSSSSSSSSSASSSFSSLLFDGLRSADLDRPGQLKMWAFSIIFSSNIAIGNVSLRYASVNFNQVMRSLVPAVAIALGACLGHKTSVTRVLAVVPVVGGVAMACYGELDLTAAALGFTSLCVVLAALKAVAAGEILTGELKLHPVDLLNKMALKSALQCLVLSYLTGELSSIQSRWSTELSPLVDYRPTFGVVSTGILSFSLNISSLMSNKLTSPLTLCIAANVKQVLMIATATAIFQTPITVLNGCGIGVVLVGSAIYSFVSVKEKKKVDKSSTVSNTKSLSSSSSSSSLLSVSSSSDPCASKGVEDNEEEEEEEEDVENREAVALIGAAR